MVMFRKAERKQRKFKACLVGPSGSGKTYTALQIAKGIGGKIALLDTESSSAELYADEFEFDHANLTDASVNAYLDAIQGAAKEGYDVIIIDSLTHAWQHLLEKKENIVKRGLGNDYTAWGRITPIYRSLLKGIVQAPIHIIATMRQKSDIVMEEYTDSKGNVRTKPVKKGTKAEFREGGEFEFDLVANIDLSHELIVEKSRILFLADQVLEKPTSKLGVEIREWLDSGKEEPEITYDISTADSTKKSAIIEYLVKAGAAQADKDTPDLWISKKALSNKLDKFRKDNEQQTN